MIVPSNTFWKIVCISHPGKVTVYQVKRTRLHLTGRGFIRTVRVNRTVEQNTLLEWERGL